MPTRGKMFATAILSMAVMLVGGWLGGCVTQRHIRELRADVQRVEHQNKETQRLLNRADSIIASGAEADNRLRAEMSVTVSELHQQIAALLENYNDLMLKIDQLSQQQRVTHVVSSSPGAQTGAPSTQQPTASDMPSIDCTTTYDEAFILVRRGEYEEAIEGFRKFMQYCPEHDYVENAYYWIGECYYSMEKYVEAVAELEYLVTEYKSSPNIGRALYKLARSKQELGKKDDARKIFQRLVDDYPGTLEAEQAREQLKVLK